MRINFGCGSKMLNDFINIDSDILVKPDRIMDLNVLPYDIPDCSVDEALWDNVVEHLTLTLPDFINEMRRILKPNGVVRIITPNSFYWKHRLSFLRGSYRAQHDWHINHSFLLKPSELRRYAEMSGFDVVNSCAGFWRCVRFLDEDLFSSTIDMRMRKRA